MDTPSASPICPVCCTPVRPEDNAVTCPHCKIVYHRECWNDNKGCATYGCPDVNCLALLPLKIDAATLGVTPLPPPSPGAANAAPSETCPQCHATIIPGTTTCWSCGCHFQEHNSSPWNRFGHWLGRLFLSAMLI